mmetsp:Transcript_75264/g.224436  ORF Transcript_75264/g.224436 Transcript_75264/m.224436 type:complete len:212 (+) Transcript_75264:395-1030(+)
MPAHFVGLVPVNIDVAGVGVLLRRDATELANLRTDLLHERREDRGCVLQAGVAVGTVRAIRRHIPGRPPRHPFRLDPDALFHVGLRPLRALLGREGCFEDPREAPSLLVLQCVLPLPWARRLVPHEHDRLLRPELLLEVVRATLQELRHGACWIQPRGDELRAFPLPVLHIHDVPTAAEQQLQNLLRRGGLRGAARGLGGRKVEEGVVLGI